MAADAAPLDPKALLTLMWLASPTLPVGGFSYSEGLESAVDGGQVHDEATACVWLVDQLHLSLARADLAVVAQALPAWRSLATDRATGSPDEPALARIEALNTWVRTTRESHELRQQAEQMGRSLCDWLRQRQPGDPRVAALRTLAPAPTWPVAFALAAVHTGAPVRDALLAHAFGWAENMVQAAIKSVPLGQSAGQRMLAALSEAIPGVVDAAMALTDAERQVCTPMLAILSARHEAQYSRLFRS
jgi:urease accessory protein